MADALQPRHRSPQMDVDAGLSQPIRHGVDDTMDAEVARIVTAAAGRVLQRQPALFRES
jgi:hypothetical protein